MMTKHRDHVSRNLGRMTGGDPYKVNPATGETPAQAADMHGMAQVGRMPRKSGDSVHGYAAKHRLDRKVKRADGGSIADPVADNAAREYIDNRGQNQYARGGAVKKGKGKTVVNVMIGTPSPAQQATPPAAPAPVAPPMPPGPPPAMPPMPPPGPMGAAPPPGMPPIARKMGGRIPKMTAGAESGEGRLEKAGIKQKHR